MKIKAMISALLAAAVLTASPVYAMEEYTPFTDTDTTAPEVLARLGIISGYEDGSFRPDNTITRAEAAAIIVNTSCDKDRIPKSTDIEYPFNDIQSSYWARDVIAFAAAQTNHFINGYEDGSFRPEENVTEEQFIKMVMCVRGYGDVCEIKGGYPKGYTDTAIKDGICKSASAAPATRGYAASAVYKALCATALFSTGFTYAPEEQGGSTMNLQNEPYGLLKLREISVADGEIVSAENGKLKVKITEVFQCNRDFDVEKTAEGIKEIEIPRLKAGEVYEMDVKYTDVYESYVEALKNSAPPTARLLIMDNSEKTNDTLTKAFTLLFDL